MFARLLRVVLAQRCWLCSAKVTGELALCDQCRDGLPVNAIACPGCAEPMPEPGLCGHCLLASPPFDAACVPYVYRQPCRSWVGRFKYGGQLACIGLLGPLFADGLSASAVERPDILLPVPLHPARLRWRGFNQSQLLAQAASRRFNILTRDDVLARVVNTQPQMALKWEERQRNLRGAFAVLRPELVADREVALVDDVMTTGATVAELAKVLKRAGARRVLVWAFARTPDASGAGVA